MDDMSGTLLYIGVDGLLPTLIAVYDPYQTQAPIHLYAGEALSLYIHECLQLSMRQQ